MTTPYFANSRARKSRSSAPLASITDEIDLCLDPTDSRAYTDAKSAWINETETIAQQWYAAHERATG